MGHRDLAADTGHARAAARHVDTVRARPELDAKLLRLARLDRVQDAVGAKTIMSTLVHVQRPIELLVLAVILLAGPAGCRQQEQPQPAPMPAQQTQPAPTASQPVSQPATQPATQTAPVSTQPTRRFSVTSVGLKPDQPVSLLGKIASDEPARLSAYLPSDHLLVIETSNVNDVRIDLPKLPRREAGRLVIQIDGQGLEVLGRGNKVVYLQRNSVGNWAFTRGPTSSGPAGR